MAQDLATPSPIKQHMIQLMDDILKQNVFQKKFFHKSRETYCAFINVFVKCIVPNSRFKEMINGNHSGFNDAITPHDEALALLILDNNFLKWKAEASKKLSKSKEIGQTCPADLKDIDLTKQEILQLPKSKYTMGTSASTNLRSGWKRQAVLDHVDHVRMILAFREKEEYNEYKSFAATCIENKKPRQRKRNRVENDFDGFSTDEATRAYENVSNEIFKVTKFSV